jgi:hypothetical protein
MNVESPKGTQLGEVHACMDIKYYVVGSGVD